MSGDVLETIDKALDDYGTGPDAMRWTPDAARYAPRTVKIRFSLDMSSLGDGLRQAGEDLRRFAEDAAPGLAKMGQSLTASLKPMQLAAHRRVGHVDRLTRIRCRVCNPRGNPKPSLHGAAYRRRQIARRRRR